MLEYALTTECVLLLQNVFSYSRMCSLTPECVLLLFLLKLQKEKKRKKSDLEQLRALFALFCVQPTVGVRARRLA